MAEVRAIDEVREIDEDRAIESMKVQIKKLWEKWLERLDTKMVPKKEVDGDNVYHFGRDI